MRDSIKAVFFKSVAENLKVSVESLNEEMSLFTDLNAKSADLVRILSDIEDEYDFTLNFMAVKRKHNLGECIDYILEVYES